MEYEEGELNFETIKLEYSDSEYSHADTFVDVSETVSSLQAPSLLLNDDPLSLTINRDEREDIVSDNNYLSDNKTDWRCTFNNSTESKKDEIKTEITEASLECTTNQETRKRTHVSEIREHPCKIRACSSTKSIKLEEYLDIEYIKIESSITYSNLEDRFVVDVSGTLQDSDHESIQDPLLPEPEGPFQSYKSRINNHCVPLPPCIKKCHTLLTEEEHKSIFDLYWKDDTQTSRVNFLNKMTKMQLGMICGKKRYDAKYYLNTQKGPKEFCRTCFRHILDENDHFITTVLEGKVAQINNKELFFQNQKILHRKKKAEIEILNKIWQPIRRCAKHCYLKITENEQRRIFDAYWKEPTYDSRFNFLNDMIEIPEKLRRKNRANFYLNTSEGRQTLCRLCFRLILMEQNAMITEIINKKFNAMETTKKRAKKMRVNNESEVGQEAECLKSQNFSAGTKPGIGFVDVSEVIPKPDSEKIKNAGENTEKRIHIKIESSTTQTNLVNRSVGVTEILQNEQGSKHDTSLNTNEQERKDIPVIKKIPVIKNIPLINQIPVIKQSPVINQTPVIKQTTVTKKIPVVKKIDIPCNPSSWSPLPSCYYKCNSLITKNEQKRIHDQYWLRTTEESRLIFANEMVEMLESPISKSQFCAKFYLNTGIGRQEVCGDCFRLIFNEKEDFIESVFQQKLRVTKKFEEKTEDRIPLNIELQEDGLNVKYKKIKSSTTGNNPNNKFVEVFEIITNQQGSHEDPISPKINVQKGKSIPVIKSTNSSSTSFLLEIEGIPANIKSREDDSKIEGQSIQTVVEVSQIMQNSQNESVNQTNLKLPNINANKNKDISDKNTVSCKSAKNCGKKCLLLIKESERKRIFESYWQNATENSRFNFVNEMTKMIPNPISKDLYDRIFYLNTEAGRQRVCKDCFLFILGETDGMIMSVFQQKTPEIIKVEENTEERKPINIESREEDPKIESAQIPLFEDYSAHTSEEKSQMFQNISDELVNQSNSKLFQIKAQTSKDTITVKNNNMTRNCVINDETKSLLVVKRTDQKCKTYYNRLREIKKVEEKTEERVPIIVASDYILQNQQDSNEDYTLSKTSVQETKETPAMKSVNTPCSSSPEICKPPFRKEVEEKIEERISTNLASQEKYLNFEFIKIESATSSDQQDLVSPNTSVQERTCKSLYKWTPLPSCPQRCNLFVKENLQKRNYDQYWYNSTKNSRFNFICNMTDMTENPWLKFKYYLSVDEGYQEVCHLCFRSTLAERNNFITKVLEYKAKNTKSVSSSALRKSISLNRLKPLLQEKKETPDTLDSPCNFTLKIWKPPLRKEVNEKTEERILINNKSLEKYLERNSINNYKPLCKWTPLSSCPQGCNLLIKENDQERNYDQYWHNSTEISRFHFVNDMTDMIENPGLDFKYYLNVNEGYQEVCRHCFRETLAECNAFITMVLEYKAKHTKSVPSSGLRNSLLLKRWKPPAEPNCKKNCLLLIKEDQQKRIFESYWQKSTYESRFNFVNVMIECVQSKGNAKFRLITDEGCKLVCRYCFGLLLDEKDDFIKVVLQSITRNIKRMKLDIESPKDLNIDNANEQTNIDSESAEIQDESVNQSNKTKINAPEGKYPPVVMKSLVSCSFVKNSNKKCLLLIEKNERKRIFDEYWLNAMENPRFNLINEMIEMVKSADNKYETRFYLNTGKGRQEVCRSCFRSLLCEGSHIIKSVLEYKLRKLRSEYQYSQ